MSDFDGLLAELSGGDESRAEAAARLLAGHGDSILPELGSLLESADPDRRWWAVRTLAAMPKPRQEWLRRALGDVSPDVRAAAALALTAHPDGAAVADLVRALDDEDGLVSMLAGGALAALGEQSVPDLIEAFDASTPRGRIQIMRALAESRDLRAIGLMMKAVSDGSAVLQYWAQEGLERLGLNMVYLKPE